MLKGHIIITAKKETFLIMALVKKLQEHGTECKFVPWTVDDINRNWNGTSLIALYMDDDTMEHMNTLHFLMDKMSDEDMKMIAIGEHEQIRELTEQVPKELLYKTFLRPLDNEVFMETIDEALDMVKSGEMRKSILIVDDDPGYLGLVREWLKDSYKVSMANSGLQAIKWLGKNKADLILLDYEMPVTSGPQVLEMLRSDSDTAGIPVIFLTGKGDKESVMSVLALKPQAYFLKTIEKDELKDKLKEFFMLNK